MLTTKENAPAAAGTADEGQTPKGSIDMSTLTQAPDTLPVKKRETIVRDQSPYTSEERAFSNQERLSRLEARYVLVVAPRTETFATPDGDTFRSAGDLYIRTCRDGVRRFTAYMHENSLQHDFVYLDEVIRDARNGRMHGWKQLTFKDGDDGWMYEYTNYQIDNLKEFKPAYVIVEKQSDAESIVGFGSDWGYPCTEPRCREKYHAAEDGSHTLESLDNALTKRGSYEIEICKDRTKPDSDWHVNFWANGDLTELTAEQIATLANDLQWMGIECATTNVKERAV